MLVQGPATSWLMAGGIYWPMGEPHLDLWGRHTLADGEAAFWFTKSNSLAGGGDILVDAGGHTWAVAGATYWPWGICMLADGGGGHILSYGGCTRWQTGGHMLADGGATLWLGPNIG